MTFRTSFDGIVTKTNLGQWQPITFFCKIIIIVETWYEIHNGEFLAIIKTFKTWHHYLEDCKHDIFVLMDYNKLHRFIDTKNLSFQQICWA